MQTHRAVPSSAVIQFLFNLNIDLSHVLPSKVPTTARNFTCLAYELFLQLHPSQRKTVTSPNLAILFFDNWYCENGLPSDIMTDYSVFWKHPTIITRIRCKASTSFHPHSSKVSENSTAGFQICIRRIALFLQLSRQNVVADSRIVLPWSSCQR